MIYINNQSYLEKLDQIFFKKKDRYRLTQWNSLLSRFYTKKRTVVSGLALVKHEAYWTPPVINVIATINFVWF